MFMSVAVFFSFFSFLFFSFPPFVPFFFPASFVKSDCMSKHTTLLRERRGRIWQQCGVTAFWEMWVAKKKKKEGKTVRSFMPSWAFTSKQSPAGLCFGHIALVHARNIVRPSFVPQRGCINFHALNSHVDNRGSLKSGFGSWIGFLALGFGFGFGFGGGGCFLNLCTKTCTLGRGGGLSIQCPKTKANVC